MTYYLYAVLFSIYTIFPINIHEIKNQQIWYAETAIQRKWKYELIKINRTIYVKTAQI